MSIYMKPLREVAWADLEAMREGRAQENVRLDFKREPLGPDKTLKMISSLANTYGGHLVIGAIEHDQVLVDLPGIPPERNYDQTVIQWCAEHLSPAVEPEVSRPIQHPDDPERVCYVIRVNMSPLAPHFIEGRCGCYVRTQDHSQRFEPRLGTYEEIERLAERRSKAIETRHELVGKLEQRYIDHVAVGGRPTALVSIVPLYPHRLTGVVGLNALLHDRLLSIAQGRTVWGFPAQQWLLQHETVLQERGGDCIAASTFGGISYGFRINGDGEANATAVVLSQVFKQALLRVRHAGHVLDGLGVRQALRLRLRMVNTKDVPVWFSRSMAAPDAVRNVSEEDFNIELDVTAANLDEPAELLVVLAGRLYPAFGSDVLEQPGELDVFRGMILTPSITPFVRE